MLCPVCATELPDQSASCAQCGAAIGNANPPAIDPISPASVSPPAIASTEPAVPLPKPAAYAPFAAQVLGLGLCLAIATLNTASNLSHGYWRVWPASIIASILAVALMIVIPRSWRKVENADAEAGYPKKVLTRCLIFVLLFVATAAIVGAAIGSSGRDTTQLIADFHEMSRLGKLISASRNSVAATVPANIAMYESIEADVDSLDDVLHRLQKELPAYDSRFPDAHETTQKSIDTVEHSLKRMELLKQQIGVARDIDGLSEDSRWKAWTERMQPLLDAEAGLDN